MNIEHVSKKYLKNLIATEIEYKTQLDYVFIYLYNIKLGSIPFPIFT